jgi:hypothetical protein
LTKHHKFAKIYNVSEEIKNQIHIDPADITSLETDSDIGDLYFGDGMDDVGDLDPDAPLDDIGDLDGDSDVNDDVGDLVYDPENDPEIGDFNLEGDEDDDDFAQLGSVALDSALGHIEKDHEYQPKRRLDDDDPIERFG